MIGLVLACALAGPDPTLTRLAEAFSLHPLGLIRVLEGGSTAPQGASHPEALQPSSTAHGLLRIVEVSRTPIEGPVLALALVGGDHLAILDGDAVLLARRGAPLSVEVREALPPPLQTVRGAAGLLESNDADSVWVWTNRTGRADLLTIAGHRVSWAAPARVPPEVPGELTFRPGTNLIEGGSGGPYLNLLPGAPTYTVSGRGDLATADGNITSPVRTGPALARVGGLLVASSAAPPGPIDHLLLLDPQDLSVVDTVEVPGAVRALAGQAGREDLFVALERGPREWEILGLKVTR